MYRIIRLVDDAIEIAWKRGHDLEKFQRSGVRPTRTATAACRRCGMRAFVSEAIPKDGEKDIYGDAITRDCGDVL
jgi:hypothetical protein